MKNMKTTFFLFILIALGFAGECQTTETGSIRGKVLDKVTKQSIPGTSITIYESAKNDSNFGGTLTDSIGNFDLNGIKAGNYTLKINLIGYQEKIVNDIRVPEGKISYVEIEIEESPSTLNEVQVNTFRYENDPLRPVSEYGFSGEEISTDPGSNGDVFRALSMLPGVASNGGEYSAIAVRGQGTHDNLYMVDDIPVSQVSHLEESAGGFTDPNGGRFSIFAPEVISDVDYIGGGFPAEYGRESASYLGLQIKEGNTQDYSVYGEMSLLGFTVNYDGPSYIFKNTSLFISGRYQNFSPVIGLTNQKQDGLPIYGDYIFKSTTQLGDKNKLTLLGIYSPETYVHGISSVLADTALNGPFILNAVNNKTVLGATLRTSTGKNSYWKNVVYFTRTYMDYVYGEAYPLVNPSGDLINGNNMPYNNNLESVTYSEQEFGYRSIFTQRFQNKSHLIIGFDLARINLNNNRILNSPDTSYVFGLGSTPTNPGQNYGITLPQYFNANYIGFAINTSGYLTYSFLVLKRITINAGVRYDYTGFSMQSTVAPRLSGNYQLNATNSLSFAAGIYYQDPILSEVADQQPGNILKEEQIQEYIVGYKKYFSPDLKLTIEGWYKNFNNLVVVPINGYSAENNAGVGWARGFDIYLIKRLSHRFHWEVGYSYMSSQRNDNNGLGVYNYDFSEPSQVNLLLAYKDSKHWVLSAKFKYASGKPTDTYVIYSNIFNNPDYVRYSEEITGINDARLPDIIELDARADYRFQIKKLGLTAFVDIADINDRLNPNSAMFNYIKGRIYYDGLAIFPSFGIKFQF